ncbi:hypothetical protein WDZ16_12935 [Pseudokineococcus marinus]|uniref:Uncharacterized protein n=1 Tax=Pseudokineococcus marinus TaxID=351215 RepID=A0A849BF03_9ACTN|nr:hypothetical protein [Pseudokineococcus marinus]NNH21639.1 hypothetical protein [Pseudokineococcus marinus]
MSRRYAAAKRAAVAEPVTFELTYEVPDLTPDEATGQPVPDAVREQVETFTCRGRVPVLLLSEFARQADLDAATPEGAALIADFFRHAFGPGEDDVREYKRFYRLVGERFDDDVLMDVLAGLVEDFGGRPTERPSTSAPGPSPTGTSSTGGGSPAAALEGPVVTLAGDGPPVAVQLSEDELAAVLAARKAPADSSTSSSGTSSTSSTPTSSTTSPRRRSASTAARSTRRSKAT